MIVTTSRRHAEQLYDEALSFSKKLNRPFIKRDHHSIKQMIARYNEDVFVVSKEKLSLYSKHGGAPFFYHPNAAMPRGKFFLRSGHDPLIEAAQLKEGMTFLDATLGLAADSLIAKLAVKESGRVVGVEAHEGIATIVEHGLKTWNEGDERIIEAMRAIEVVCADHLTYLRSLPDKSFDVVYFDPLFEEAILDSSGIEALRSFAIDDDLSVEAIEEAKRVARKRVVLKDHYKSSRFQAFRFQVIKRSNAAFYYGFIEVG